MPTVNEHEVLALCFTVLDKSLLNGPIVIGPGRFFFHRFVVMANKFIHGPGNDTPAICQRFLTPTGHLPSVVQFFNSNPESLLFLSGTNYVVVGYLIPATTQSGVLCRCEIVSSTALPFDLDQFYVVIE